MKNHSRWMRGILLAGAMTLLLSCGGGGGGGSAVSSAGIDGRTAVGNGSGSAAGTGDGSTGTAGGADGSGSTGGGASGSTGAGTDGGTDGTSTAGNGSGDGVGSGGTGVSTADATGVGSVGGLGSIILNGVRYNTDAATFFSLEDTTELQIGMSVRIAGKIDSAFTAATAQQVVSAAELRGAVSSINLAGGSFVVMGTTVTTDNATVWSGAKSLDKVPNGTLVQVWGLPSEPGALRATRIELNPASSEPLATGYVQSLDTLRKTFMLGQLTVKYRDALFLGGIDESALAGALVRARGSVSPGTGMLIANKVQGWYAIPTQNTAAVQLAGVITNYNGTSDFKVLGTAINASQAQIPPGQLASIDNGVKVELDGFMTNGVLLVKKLRVRNVPGMGGPVSFTLIGPVVNYQSASDFMVRGQRVDASGSSTVFENGTATDLANLPPSRPVTVVGDTVENGVLIAKRVTFTQR